MEADTVSHGGGSSSGEFLWSSTLTDLHTGWTELAALWGNSGSEVRVGLVHIKKRMPFALLGLIIHWLNTNASKLCYFY